MKVCCVAALGVGLSEAAAGWCRALDAERKSFEEVCALLATQELRSELLFVVLSPATVSWLEPLERLLAASPGALLIVWVEAELPTAPRELDRYRRALAAADAVFAAELTLCRQIEGLTTVRAVDVLPPWLDAPPRAYLEPSPRIWPSKPRLAVVSGEVNSHARLLRFLGTAAYAWTRLRCAISFHAPSADARELATSSDLVLLPEVLGDGARLAAHCAEAGTLLIAPRAEHSARFCFPFTGYAEGRAGALLLWLQSASDVCRAFREHAAHRARQLSDGDRRAELVRAIRQQCPRFTGELRGSYPSLWDEILHVSGPADWAATEGECVAVCLVRNGGEHIPSFLEHHRALGVRHFVFVDNGSDDGSRALLEAQPDAIVYSSTLPHKHYENELRRLVIERHCQRRWCLNVDVDELFDYPGSTELPISGLLRYLRRSGATAMVAYLLDMFARENVFGEVRAVDLKREYPFYDIDDVEKSSYAAEEIAGFCDQNLLCDEAVGCYFGGIRRRVFGGKERAQFLLTKHPLVFLDGVLQPVVHPHYVNRARVADVTGVLRHYKLTPSFQAKVNESVASDRYIEFAQRQYDEYQRRVEGRASLVIDTPGRRRLESVEQLVDEGFLRVSRAYRALIGPRRDAPVLRATETQQTGAVHG